MFDISQLDIRTVRGNIIKRTRIPSRLSLIVILLTIFNVHGCTAVTWFDDGRGNRSCKAHCRTLAEDGKSCVEWSETASDACVGKYTPAAYCCVGWGRRCTLAAPGAKGFACACQVATPYGFTYAQGQACN